MFHCELQRLNGNEQLCSDWRDLRDRVRPELRLFGPEWFSIWDRTLGSHAPWTGDMQVVAVYEETSRRLCGVLPIGHPKAGLLRVNAMAGSLQPWRLALADQTCEFAVGRALGWFLVELGWSVLQLGPWPLSHEVHRGILSALGELEMPMRKHGTAELAIAELPATWEQYQAETVDREFLNGVRNDEQQLAREHQIEVQHIRQPSPFETAELLAAFAHIEQRSRPVNAADNPPRFSGLIERGFWAELIQQWLAPQNYFDAWLLLADGEPISFIVAATVGSTRYVIANDSDEVWRDATRRDSRRGASCHNVGAPLELKMFEEGYSRGVTRYDFGTHAQHDPQLWGAKPADRVETVTVAINHVVSGFWNAGVKLQSLLDGGVWGRPKSSQQLAHFDPPVPLAK
ncbi:MAG: hypothetical protein ACKV2Q_32485 [Planctomycetaceae bacterium]